MAVSSSRESTAQSRHLIADGQGYRDACSRLRPEASAFLTLGPKGMRLHNRVLRVIRIAVPVVDPTPTIRVLVCHEQPLVRAGLRAILERESGIEVVGEAANAGEAVAVARHVRPTIVIMDIAEPCRDVIEAIRVLSAPGFQWQMSVVALSPTDEEDVLEAVRAGARGLLLKSSPAEEMLRATRAVVAGEGFITPRIAGWLLGDVARRLPPRRQAPMPCPCGALHLVSSRSSASSLLANRMRRSQRRSRCVRRRSGPTCTIS